MGSHITPNVDAILNQLTLEEKVSLLAGKNFWETVDIPEKGVPSVKVGSFLTESRSSDPYSQICIGI
jgi:hypothetical protein